MFIAAGGCVPIGAIVLRDAHMVKGLGNADAVLICHETLSQWRWSDWFRQCVYVSHLPGSGRTWGLNFALQLKSTQASHTVTGNHYSEGYSTHDGQANLCDRTVSPGGSSSGSAAAVVANQVIFAWELRPVNYELLSWLEACEGWYRSDRTCAKLAERNGIVGRLSRYGSRGKLSSHQTHSGTD